MFITRLSKTLLICCGVVSITGCILLTPYEAELGQGNFIRTEQIEEVSVGQTSDQVAFLLGTPLLTGETPSQRWVYTTFSEAEGYKKLIIYFTDGVVSDIVYPATPSKG